MYRLFVRRSHLILSHIDCCPVDSQIEKKLVELLKNDLTWEIMSKLVRSVFPLLIVLRLSDQQEPFMDKLYYYVRRMDTTLVKSRDMIDAVEKQFKLSSWRTLYDINSKEDCGSDSDSPESEYDSETCAEDDSDEMTSLSQKVLDIWNKRRKKLVNDFTIAGWLLSPIPEVYLDASLNSTGEHRDACDRLMKKMFASDLADDSDELADLHNYFWDEFEHFKSKTGPYNKAYIWKESNPDLHHGRSHMWHKKNSIPFTKVFGKFACRVCSKIVGMGSAERNWGDVKHLKTDKRAHLSSEAVQKQATIFGASCMLNARLERESKKGTFEDPYKFWNEEDFDGEFASFSNSNNKAVNENVRVFKCYFEDWEKEHVHQKDDVSKAKFLQKYGGLEFDDVDEPVHYWIAQDKLHFQRRSKYEEGGWCILARRDQSSKGEDEGNIDDTKKANEQRWSLFADCALIDCIASYYTHHPHDNVKLVMRKGQAKEILNLTLCGGCGSHATPHHKCDKCNCNMHLQCGRAIGVVEERSKVRCPKCDVNKQTQVTLPHDSSSVKERLVTDSLTTCGGCGVETGPAHKCDKCSRHMHPFCGRTIGEEGHGAPVRCPRCDL